MRRLLALTVLSLTIVGCEGGPKDVPPPSAADAATQPPLPTAGPIGAPASSEDSSGAESSPAP
jgi:hypothetical protein